MDWYKSNFNNLKGKEIKYLQVVFFDNTSWYFGYLYYDAKYRAYKHFKKQSTLTKLFFSLYFNKKIKEDKSLKKEINETYFMILLHSHFPFPTKHHFDTIQALKTYIYIYIYIYIDR